MKTVIYYFSGTGNTEKVVNAAADALRGHGWDAAACAIERAENVAETVPPAAASASATPCTPSTRPRA